MRIGVAAVFAVLFAWIAIGHSNSRFAQIVVVVLAAGLLLLTLGTAVFLILNSVIVIRREGRSLANLLPAVVGLFLIALPLLAALLLTQRSIWSIGLLVACLLVAFYITRVFAAFFAFSVIYRASTRRPTADVVLVLGSKIFDGKPPPLLQCRIDRAIDVYRQREAAGESLPVLVFSGGQGADESRSEAAAMAEYAESQGIPPDHAVLEDQAVNTRQNLQFGVAIAQQVRPGGSLLIATNDYHTFRAALIARSLGLRAEVIAAPTASYYVPSAYLREFIAVLRDYLWWHIAVVACLVGFVGFLVWESSRH